MDAKKIANALKEEFCSIISEYAQKPFSETGVHIPPDDIWLRYAKAAINEVHGSNKGSK